MDTDSDIGRKSGQLIAIVCASPPRCKCPLASFHVHWLPRITGFSDPSVGDVFKNHSSIYLEFVIQNGIAAGDW